MRVIETTVYQYGELSDKAKGKARDWYREASQGDNSYSEFVIEDAATIAGLLGIELKQHETKFASGKSRFEPVIAWSGFWSQGDGASFEGEYSAPETGSALDRVKAHAPTDEKLHALAERLDALQATYGNQLTATISLSRGNACHSNMMQIEAHNFNADGDDQEVPHEHWAELTKVMRAYADWIYLQLQNEYEYQNSDEQVAETIEANEYEFTADGMRFEA